MSRIITVNHLARIEGHGGITVVLDGQRVERVDFDIFEGLRLFEALVRGRFLSEVPAIVSRICGICSHSHAVTAVRTLERALGVEVTRQTKRLRELAFHGAAIESHALHAFCLALPDFLGRASVLDIASTDPGTVERALRLKRLGNSIQEVLGGRAVHPVNYVIGGFGKLPSADDLLRLRQELVHGLDDCAQAVAALGEVTVPVFTNAPLRCAALRPEADSYFFGSEIRAHDGSVTPVEEYRRFTNEFVVPHSNAKHSLRNGKPYLVGALARLTLNGDRIDGLARSAWERLGPAVPCRNVVMNDIAQVVELVFSIEQGLKIVDDLIREGVQREQAVAYQPRAGKAAGAAEVPRGILFHQYEFDDQGLITAADVITPTAQNLAHAEEQFRSLVAGAAGASDEELTGRLQILARAYDPCVSCSVHVLRVK